MGLFDFLKKKEPTYDPANLTIHDLRAGFIFDYDLKTWIIREEYLYDWGDHYFTREFKIDSGDDSAYLHIDDNDDLFITLTKKIRIRSIDEDIPEVIKKDDKPPKKLIYNEITFYLEGTNPGYFSNDPKSDNWAELISWDYYDTKGEFTLAIEQWGEDDFEAAFGRVIKEFEFSNILPSNQ